MQQTIRRIVIVGGGSAGWMTAAALAKSLGARNHDITLVESEDIGTVGVGEATIPGIRMFNDVLGIDEDVFMRETQATFKLGIAFDGWRKAGAAYFHPFGNYGADMEGIAFTQYWLRQFKAGGSADFGQYNVETEAARAGRFGRTPPLAPGPGPGPGPGPAMQPAINYAFHFDAGLYAGFLRRYAEDLGVVRREGRIMAVRQDAASGDITAVQLTGGTTIAGDLFIDCSGFRSLLLGETLKVDYEDWSRWLPVNRALAAPSLRKEAPVPYTRSTAREAGWQWRIPLQHRTGNGYVFCDAYIGEDAALNTLMDTLDGDALAEPRLLKFTTGHRRQYWKNNCIAVGLAAGFLEPLESTGIHLIQTAITQLLSVFPKTGIQPAVVRAYNRAMDEVYTNVRDFIIAHYKVTQREDTAFWRYCKTMEIPDSLQDRLEVFAGQGNAMVRQGELFREQSWFAVLMGQGLVPRDYNPVADNLSRDQLNQRLKRVRDGVCTRVAGLPLHGDFIAAHCAVPAPIGVTPIPVHA